MQMSIQKIKGKVNAAEREERVEKGLAFLK